MTIWILGLSASQISRRPLMHCYERPTWSFLRSASETCPQLTDLLMLIWPKIVHFARPWISWYSIQSWFHQKCCRKYFNPLAPWHTTTNARSISPYPIGVQFLKVIFFFLQFSLQIHIPRKKLHAWRNYLFPIFWKKVVQISQKLEKLRVT